MEQNVTISKYATSNILSKLIQKAKQFTAIKVKSWGTLNGRFMVLQVYQTGQQVKLVKQVIELLLT